MVSYMMQKKCEPEMKDYKALYEKLLVKVADYQKAIRNIGFAEIEYKALARRPETPEALFDAICQIIDTSRELNLIIDQSPSSIYVADVNGKTLRINRSFEELTELDRKSLLNRTTQSIEEDNIFMPSVCSLALSEGRRVVVQQTVKNSSRTKEFITAGVPILDESGNIVRVITNALLSEESTNISDYWCKSKERKKTINAPVKLIASSRQMQEILQLVDLVKNTESTIIIEGETGVGKSMLARYIHESSNRSQQKMTEINCGAIPPQLLESELFGYVSGAFTGASKKGKEGLIEASEGGTILLDEISELPLLLQVKLLHFLQNRRITRIGDTKEIPVDVRVIAATNKRLELLVEKGEFRSDLYYRLNVVPIIIPPLRERKDDIMPAVHHFAEKYAKLYNKHLDIQQRCIDYFMSNPWKGNLRELENFVERLVVVEGNLEISNDMNPTKACDTPIRQQAKEKAESPLPPCRTIDDVERTMILQAYEKYGSSYKVAQALGISQSTAYRKIRKYKNQDSK